MWMYDNIILWQMTTSGIPEEPEKCMSEWGGMRRDECFTQQCAA